MGRFWTENHCFWTFLFERIYPHIWTTFLIPIGRDLLIGQGLELYQWRFEKWYATFFSWLKYISELISACYVHYATYFCSHPTVILISVVLFPRKWKYLHSIFTRKTGQKLHAKTECKNHAFLSYGKINNIFFSCSLEQSCIFHFNVILVGTQIFKVIDKNTRLLSTITVKVSNRHIRKTTVCNAVVL